MAYNEFDLDKVLNSSSRVSRGSVVLEGMGQVKKIFSSKSNSAEEFLSASASDLGRAERNVMFVNMQLNALGDRLRIASKLSKEISERKAHGQEAYTNMPVLDPMTYAIEGKVKDFFKRLWEAIKAACRRSIPAIANFIKWIGVQINQIGVKGQIVDYNAYKANASVINKMAKAEKVDDVRFNSLSWKVDANGIAKLLNKLASHYHKLNVKGADQALLEKVSRTDLKKLEDPKDFAKAYSSIFGIQFDIASVKNVGSNRFHGRAKERVESMIRDIEKDMETGIRDVFGGTIKDTRVSGRALVMSAVSRSDKPVKITVGQMKKLSGDFACLSDVWLAENIKKTVASITTAQKQFTQYTHIIDRIAAAFDKVNDNAKGASSLSYLASQLSNTRIRYNGFYTGVMLELETAALRFRRSAHIALKQYLKAGKATTAPKKGSKKSGESYDDYFTFD